MKPINVGLIGIGTVGGGTWTVLKRNAEEITRRAGRGIEITMVADLDVVRARSVVGADVQVVSDARAIIANPEIDIVIELIGGYGIARTLVMEAIAAARAGDVQEASARLAGFVGRRRDRQRDLQAQAKAEHQQGQRNQILNIIGSPTSGDLPISSLTKSFGLTCNFPSESTSLTLSNAPKSAMISSLKLGTAKDILCSFIISASLKEH